MKSRFPAVCFLFALFLFSKKKVRPSKTYRPFYLAMSGSGSIHVDLRDASVLASLSSKLFTSSHGATLSTQKQSGACSTTVKTALSPNLVISFLVPECNSVKAVTSTLEKALNASGIVLTGSFGAILKDSIPPKTAVQVTLFFGTLYDYIHVCLCALTRGEALKQNLPGPHWISKSRFTPFLVVFEFYPRVLPIWRRLV